MTDAQEASGPLPSDLTWPSFFPDRCPPAEATPAEGSVLRLVRNDPPRADDFLPWAIENDKVPKSKHCQACAVSVFERIDELRKMQRRVPAQRPKAVAEGELKPEMGVTKRSSGKGRSHRSWWIPDGLDPSPLFRVIAPPLQQEEA